MFQKKICRENKTRILYSKSFFYSVVYEKMWKNIVETDRLEMTICHTQMATNSHSEYVKYIPFALQQ